MNELLSDTNAKRLAEEEFPKMLNAKLLELIEASKKEMTKAYLDASNELEGDAGNDIIDECACEEQEEDEEENYDKAGSDESDKKKTSGKKPSEVEIHEMVAITNVGNKDRLKKTAPGYNPDFGNEVHKGAPHDNDRLAAAKKKLAIKETSEEDINEDANLLAIAIATGFTAGTAGGAYALDKIKSLMRYRSKIKANIQPGTPKGHGFRDGEMNKLNVHRYTKQDEKKDYLEGYNLGQTFWKAKNNGLFESAELQLLDEKRRIVIKINNKGRRRRKIMCGKGKKLVGSTCKPISGKEKQVKRVAVRKMKRTLKRKGQGAKKRALRLRKRALVKRHSMGL